MHNADCTQIHVALSVSAPNQPRHGGASERFGLTRSELKLEKLLPPDWERFLETGQKKFKEIKTRLKKQWKLESTKRM